MTLVTYTSSAARKNSQIKILTITLILFFILNPAFDLISTLLSTPLESSNRLSLLSRGVFTLIVSTFALTIALQKQRSFLLVLLPVLFTTLSIFSWYFLGFYEESVAFETVNVAFKAFSFFFFCIAFKYLFKNGGHIESIELIVKLSFLAYTTAIILGPVLGIDSFKSYGEVRFGYKGIILAQNEASALLLVGLLLFGYKIVIGSSNKLDSIGIIFAVTAAFIIGTKAAFILPISILTIILISKNGIVKSSPFILLTLAAFPITIYSLTLVSSNVQDVLDSTTQYLTYQLSNYANNSIFTLLLSGRDDKLIYALNNIVEQNPFYLVLGGYPLGFYSIELDFFDLSLLFGIPAFLIYLLNLKNEFLKNKKGITLRYYTLAFILVIAVSNSAGHLLTSALALPYLAFFCVYGSVNNQKNR
ncbi:O-antigen ligase family protein [Pseudomonas sp. PDM29]|uniref:O-antigen ligase family protein n=1 Tax=unclassified Pseudomonas TaxID=196821 RepID=UPI001C44272E|nr:MULTISPECIES: O-antigen ligase family protein [unclassified Pseudomonas]MBV7523249.1 O-antigen ligase family protein [Pseudomonas sp. PDM29]